MKQRSLINQLMTRFAAFMVVLLVVSTPLFYLIVTDFYAEDLREAALAAGIPSSEFDLEEDTIMGLVLQVMAIVVILGLSIFLIMRLVPTKLWRPFHDTLAVLARFKVEDGRAPVFGRTDTKEFTQLNDTLTRILAQSARSYQVQKQFTENASHELQTPLAIAQGKLDLLLQDEQLTSQQAALIDDVYHELSHMSLLNRNLLLLARIENAQYKKLETVDLPTKLRTLLPSLTLLADGLAIHTHLGDKPLSVACNEVLLEAALKNLVVNAVRHNRAGGSLTLTVGDGRLTVSNTSNEPPLDTAHLFERFHQSGAERKGNGLGLAIVKSICDYHGWTVGYAWSEGQHAFTIDFNEKHHKTPADTQS